MASSPIYVFTNSTAKMGVKKPEEEMVGARTPTRDKKAWTDKIIQVAVESLSALVTGKARSYNRFLVFDASNFFHCAYVLSRAPCYLAFDAQAFTSNNGGTCSLDDITIATNAFFPLPSRSSIFFLSK